MADSSSLQAIIDSAFEQRASLDPASAPASLRTALDEALGLLDSGAVRVAEKQAGRWVVNQWLKRAVLLHFRVHDNQVLDAGYTRFYDKLPLKFATHDEA